MIYKEKSLWFNNIIFDDYVEGVIFISFYQQALVEMQRLKKELQRIQEQLDRLPEGKLNCVRNGSRIKWFHSDGHSQTYIPKSQKEYAAQLALCRYLLELQKYDQKELQALCYYLRHTEGDNNKAKRLLTEKSPYQELLATVFQPESQELHSWMNSPYIKNKKYPEQLKYKTCKDEYVRSKSEALIAMVLYMHKIPYRYECELTLGNMKVYPDFTICHPQTGKLFYWEHFGMMDMPDYAKNAVDKIVRYTRNEIYPDIQLITTYETKDQPLDIGKVQKLILYHFGDEHSNAHEEQMGI